MSEILVNKLSTAAGDPRTCVLDPTEEPVPSTSSSAFDSLPLVSAWYTPTSSFVASLTIRIGGRHRESPEVVGVTKCNHMPLEQAPQVRDAVLKGDLLIVAGLGVLQDVPHVHVHFFYLLLLLPEEKKPNRERAHETGPSHGYGRGGHGSWRRSPDRASREPI
ncbi:hypothetical protein EYF80_006305 [Liparis tanakae]|uniref:Uncharacterized protein n=1 Tax=Liparis tanakae TaxID=230148 RepID=A0A4Z2J0J6_9TELE|nr:hypothetical protein EYF80_006305 [Liparis tanakae]